MKIIFWMTILFGVLCAEPPYLPIGRELMEEVQELYEEQKITLFLEEYSREKGLEIESDKMLDIEDDMLLFFESDQFIVTGAAYLSSLFSEAELTNLLEFARDEGDLFSASSEEGTRLNRLFKTLDPHLYRYLKQKLRRR